MRVRALTQTQHTAQDNMVDVQENSKSLHLTWILFFLFSLKAPVLLLHVLIDCSLRVPGDHAQEFVNPPVITTPQPSLRGTGKTWILLHYMCMSLATA